MPDARWIMVGEAPPRRGVAFEGPGWDRMADAVGGSLWSQFELTNLMSRPQDRWGKASFWPRHEARAVADAAWLGIVQRDEDARLLLLGRRVAWAFRLPVTTPFLEWTTIDGVDAVVIPHPSGVSRWHNDPANGRLLADFLRGCAA